MITHFKNFWKEDEGQDLIEYTLLLAFVALVAAGLFIQAGTVTAGIWGTANSVLTSANAAAS
jgi:Flp pilus assembly pilin Flp